MTGEHTLDVLDFGRIRQLVAAAARTPQGEAVCRRLAPAPDPAAAREAQAEVVALAALEPELGLPPLDGIGAIETHLGAARREGTCLDVTALLAVRDSVAGLHRVHEYLEDAAAEGSLVGAYGGRMRTLYPLADRFERTFGPRGEVLDGASPRLRELRAEIRGLRDRILKILRAVLRDADLEPAVQDDFVTLRADRYVIPLRTDFRGYLRGIVHDRSRTGATFFVEPLEVVEPNNRLGAVREEEAEEIRRILVELTRRVGAEAGAIRANLAVAAHLDALAARLSLSRRLGGVAVDLVDEPVLDLRAARHPLLAVQDGVEVVPVDLRVGDGHRLLLVTGANAGGKTVALKTAGLLVVMARSGLLVPAAEGSRVGWFEPVFADIGDEQDIDRHLSTFSAHMANLRGVLESAGPGSLVLLDELGAGTSPREGAALAMAVLETLLDRGAFVVATTHLEGLKAFAHARPDAQNAAVAFDPATGHPLYRLLYGRAGASNAFEVAQRLGLPAEVLRKARAYAAGQGEPGSDVLAELDAARDAAREEAERAAALRAEWERRVAEADRLRDAARAERDAAREAARAEARRAVDEARREMARVIRRFAQEKATQQQAEQRLRGVADQLDRELAPERPGDRTEPAPAAEPGSTVRVRSLGRDGVVDGVLPGGKVAVRVGGLRVTVDRADLAAAGPGAVPLQPDEVPAVRVDAHRSAADLVVVGCTVDEALARVDKALDRALVAGVDAFRIVHGRGTGALRRAIREHLAGEPRVAVLAPEQEDAATRVELA